METLSNCEEDSYECEVFCTSCDQTFPKTEVYCCRNCFEFVEAECTQENQSVFLCELCAVIHIRKNHEVVDCRGYQPAFCEEHKRLSLMFCETCQVVFCFKCIGPHCKHDYKLVSEKASEVRKQMFNYLSKFDDFSKPLAKKKSVYTNCAKRRDEHYPNSKADVLMDGLYGKFQDLVSANSKDWKKIVEEKLSALVPDNAIHDLSDRADSNISNLRHMFAMSDGVCVSQFLGLKASLDSSVEEQKSELKSIALVSSCVGVGNFLKSSLELVFRQLALEEVEKHVVVDYPLVLYNDNSGCRGIKILKQENSDLFVDGDNLVNLEMLENKSLKFSIFTATTRANSSYYCTSNKEYSFAVSSVNTVLLKNGYVAFFDSSKPQVSIFTLSNPNSDPIFLDIGEDFEPVKFLSCNNNVFTFILWNKDESTMEIYPYKSENHVFASNGKPLLVENMGTTITFLEKDTKVIVADFSSGLKIEISPNNHGLWKIDKIILHRDPSSKTNKANRLSLFDYSNKLGVMCSFSLDSLYSWKLNVIKVRRFVLPDKLEEDQITWLNLIGNTLFVSTDTHAFFDCLHCLSSCKWTSW